MFFFKPKRVDPENVHIESEKTDDTAQKGSGELASGQVGIELTKINAQIDSIKETRKGVSEQISQIREQIGELRGMIVNTDKTVSQMEVKTTKAVDMVESVQPDKLMIMIQKQDSKVEALRGNIESNENMMKTILADMKDIRLKMGVFKGLDQVIRLTEESKSQITNVTKINANIERHSDKIESIYTEFQKSFSDFRQLSEDYKSLTKQFKDIQSSFDQTKVKVDGLAAKKELENLISKFNDFEKRVSGVVELIDKHANDLPILLEEKFQRMENRMEQRFDHFKKIRESIEKFEKDFPKVSEQLKMPQSPEEKPIPPIPSELPKLGEKPKLEQEKKEGEKKQGGFFASLFKKKEEVKT
ncbi:MAG: hypothetical protein AABX51_04735 [Nanoarchaeota archaeon]